LSERHGGIERRRATGRKIGTALIWLNTAPVPPMANPMVSTTADVKPTSP
jgi:hypothetical protein